MRLSELIRAHQSSSELIRAHQSDGRGHQSSSERTSEVLAPAIRGHQRPSSKALACKCALKPNKMIGTLLSSSAASDGHTLRSSA